MGRRDEQPITPNRVYRLTKDRRSSQVLAMTLGLAIGAIFLGEAIPSVILPVYITLNMLVCGFFVREETIPIWWHWLYDISFMQWVFSALCINQFENQEYNQICEGTLHPPRSPAPYSFKFVETDVQLGCGIAPVTEGLDLPLTDAIPIDISADMLDAIFGECQPIQGEAILMMFGISNRGKWLSLGYACCSFPVLLVMTYFAVKFIRHTKT